MPFTEPPVSPAEDPIEHLNSTALAGKAKMITGDVMYIDGGYHIVG